MIYFKHNEIDGCSNCIEFEAVIDNISAGRCVLLLEEDAVVTEISCDSDKTFVIEGLIKAAFNYSANRNYYNFIQNFEFNVTSFLAFTEHFIPIYIVPRSRIFTAFPCSRSFRIFF